MWLMISGFLCFIIAVVLGAYRNFCLTIEAKDPGNIPPIWRSSVVRAISWIIVAVTSTWFAFVCATLIRVIINDLLGKFSFGVLLVLRWAISAMIGSFKADKSLSDFEAEKG